MPPPGSLADQPDEAQALVKFVQRTFDEDDKLHKQLVKVWNEQYGLYRNFRQLRQDIRNAVGTREMGGVLLDAKRQWNAQLFIPLAYSTIETIVPRAISNPPEMTARPNTPDAADAAKRIAQALNKQQEDTHYELILQAAARRGFLHGLGVTKTYWDESYRKGKLNVPVKGLIDRVKFPSGLKAVDYKIEEYVGPCSEDVDIFDFFWPRTAKNIKTCDHVIHRTWRPMEYVAKMVQRGRDTNGEKGWNDLDLEKVKGLGSSGRDDVWRDRMQAAGMSGAQTSEGNLHEVWEYHDRKQVITVLDRQLLVQQKPNPCYHGDLAFQIFRPTVVSGEMCGIGEVEPIADLIIELNTLRGQRRDNATLKLQPPTFFQQGLLQTQDVVYGPGVFVPVLGDPREAVYPLPVGDIPGSGYQEEEVIKSDVDKTTGISDAVAGGAIADTSQATATGIQLVQAAANVRIALKTRNLIREMVKPSAAQFLWLNRQHQFKDKTMRIDTADGEYAFVTVKRSDWNKNVEIIPDGKSTEPDNLPQQRQDALTMLNGIAPFIQAGMVKGPPALTHFLKEYGIADAEGWIEKAPPPGQPGAPQDGGAPQQGFDPAIIGQAIDQAQVSPEQQDAILKYIQQAMTQQAPAGNGAAQPQGA